MYFTNNKQNKIGVALVTSDKVGKARIHFMRKRRGRTETCNKYCD